MSFEEEQRKVRRELDAEIKQLRSELNRSEFIGNKRAEALEFKDGILARAANTIERVTQKLDFIHSSTWEAYGIPDLIQELRDAAK